MTNPTPTEAAKLLPCPWCASTPDQYAAKGEQVETTGHVWCGNLQCSLQPKVQAPTLNEAINAWNTRPQPAPPAGEPDFMGDTLELLIRHGMADAARTQPLCRDIAASFKRMYRLGAASRPKVEDGPGSYVEKLLGDRAVQQIRAGDAENLVSELEDKLAEREAELAEVPEVADKIAAEPPTTPNGRHDDWQHGWQDGAMEVAAVLREAHAARQQQKAPAGG